MYRSIIFFLLIIVVSNVVSGTTEDMALDIVEALTNAHFEDWSDAFIKTNDEMRGQVLPSTLFIPNASYGGVRDKRKLAAYHVVSERLEFADLLLKASQSRLPTLLTNYSIVVTNNSESGFAVDDVLITEADAFLDTFIAIHIIASPLHFEMHGDPRVEPKPSDSTTLNSYSSTFKSEWSFISFILVTVVARIISEIFILSG